MFHVFLFTSENSCERRENQSSSWEVSAHRFTEAEVSPSQNTQSRIPRIRCATPQDSLSYWREQFRRVASSTFTLGTVTFCYFSQEYLLWLSVASENRHGYQFTETRRETRKGSFVVRFARQSQVNTGGRIPLDNMFGKMSGWFSLPGVSWYKNCWLEKLYQGWHGWVCWIFRQERRYNIHMHEQKKFIANNKWMDVVVTDLQHGNKCAPGLDATKLSEANLNLENKVLSSTSKNN